MERKNTIKSRQLLFQDFVFNVLCMIKCTQYTVALLEF